MRKFTIAVIIFYILIQVKLQSQPYGWFTQTSGTANNLGSVYFSNTGTGFAVGQYEKMMLLK